MHLTPALLAATALLGGMTSPAVARTAADPRAYTIRYDAPRGTYCIRFFSDALAADPHPGGPALRCRTRAQWAHHKVMIHAPARPDEAAR